MCIYIYIHKKVKQLKASYTIKFSVQLPFYPDLIIDQYKNNKLI